jgi:XTP/dITP diphosphohydrolase
LQILVATSNRHKLQEIRDVLSIPGLTLLSMAELDSPPDVVEDGLTFEANAIKKASELARYSQMWTMADDSGLEVAALGGAPGVYSARYAGEPVDYKANNRKLLLELDGKPDRSARFVCVIALCDPDGNCRTVEGTVEGVIAVSERGHEGFGYDPLFVPKGYTRTLAELSFAEKNRMSHRANALAAAIEAWADLLGIDRADADQGEVAYIKIAELKSEFIAQRVGEELSDRGIPHVIRSYRDSAYDGIFQQTLGWGHVEAPESRAAEVRDIVAALE